MSAGQVVSWPASSPTGASQELAEIQAHLTVRMIATPRRALMTCRADEPVGDVLARSTETYDFLPVVDREDDHIVGLLAAASLAGEAESGATVGEAMQSLSERNLIGADAAILDFVRDADRHPCRLVIAGRDIYGLVSLSDLQRLPARAALFTMITRLEMTMAEAIRRDAPEASTWMARLSDERREKLATQIVRSLTHDAFVDELLFTGFADKRTIIEKSPAFTPDRRIFWRDMTRLEKLRDRLVHANHYAAIRDAASSVCESVRLADRWLKWLESFPQPLS